MVSVIGETVCITIYPSSETVPGNRALHKELQLCAVIRSSRTYRGECGSDFLSVPAEPSKPASNVISRHSSGLARRGSRGILYNCSLLLVMTVTSFD